MIPRAVRRRRGEPLLVMLLLGGGWVGLRVTLWEAPVDSHPAFARVSAPGITASHPKHDSTQVRPSQPAIARIPDRAGLETRLATGHASGPGLPSLPARNLAGVTVRTTPLAEPPQPWQAPAQPPLAKPANAVIPTPALAQDIARWRADGWIAWRQGSGSSGSAAGRPLALAYGGSQGGLVIRHDLGSGPLRPQAYLRGVYAPRPRQHDLAVGASLRPVASVPVRVQLEGRLTQAGGDKYIRPAAFAVTEVPVVELPLGLRAEGYAQAGWVGGKYSTGFIDGSARIDREILSTGAAEVRAGAGAWGGAQKFASRLDIGPSMTIDLRNSGVPARVALDYRFRVLGRAQPDSGLAVTLSTGF